MSGKLVRLAILWMAVFLVSTSLAFAQSDTNIIYPGYHGPSQRTGQNPDATRVNNPAELTLIWAYPRTPAVAASDNMLDQDAALSTGAWITGVDGSAYPTPGPSNYSYAPVDTTGASTMTWNFPAGAPTNAPEGRYRVWVWYPGTTPAGTVATNGAVYTVVDRNRTYTYVIDQSQGGGTWVQLGNTFEFNSAAQYVSITTNSTDATPNAIVMADGVRFERDTSAVTIADDTSSARFTTTGTWNTGYSTGTTGLVSAESYDGGFHYVAARGTGDPLATATWSLPAGIPTGRYMVYAWFPQTYDNNAGGLVNTSSARYTVGGTTFEVDQSDDSLGGTWVPISSRAISLSSTDTISISNQTGDSSPAANTIVVADAVRLVPATGAEFYASPTAGEVPVDWDFGADGTYQAKIPVVYTASVEPPLTDGEDPQDVGSIVCINGVTPELAGMPAALSDRLKQSLGTALWEYPSANPALRDPLEGPVQNGFYSTPTLVYWMDNSVSPSVRRAAVVATGMDGQIYALDAEGIANADKSVTLRKSKLLWKGPGITASEPYAGGPYPNPNPGLWQTVAGRTDAYGGQFLAATCSDPATPGAPILWRFDDNKRKMAGEPGAPGSGSGWAYNVSVWIPAIGSSVNGKLPATDAVYKVTYETPDDASAVQTVTVNLAETKNQGRWVSLGTYFNVKQVQLETTTKQGTPANYAVVADACMIVPDQVGAFGYASPVADINTYGNLASSQNGRLIYAVTSEGRAMSINIAPVTFAATGESFGKVNWFYPAVREKMIVSGSADDTQPGLGPVVASPTYSIGAGLGAPGRLLIATTDQWGGEGEVICLTGLDYGMTTPPVVAWQFPSTTDDSDRPLSFSSSPAVANGRVYIGSEYGSFYCMNLETVPSGTSQVFWKYPSSASGVPLGAFRYSTPAFATTDAVSRVWIGSADGKIYSFNAENAVPDAERRMSTSGTAQYFTEPNTRSSVYSSVTLDGRSALIKPEIMYAGTMADQGILRWYLARSGMVGSGWNSFGWPALGPIFGSPTPAQTVLRRNNGVETTGVDYVYFTAGDGRVYALSSKVGYGGGNPAWGGEWSGGGWLYNTPEGENPLIETLPTETGGDIQFELVGPRFFDNSFTADPEPRDTTPPNNYIVPATWDATQWIVRENMKLVSPTDATGATTLERNQNLNALLATRAKEVRDLSECLFPSRADRMASRPIYIEWGETIYLALWNINPDDLKSGQSSIEIKLHNASAGSGAGMELAAKVRAYREYTVLDSTTRVGITDQYLPLKYFGTQKNVRRAYLLAQVDLKSSGSRPPSPGPGWEIYAKVAKSTGDETIDLAKLVLLGTIPVPKMNSQVDPGAAQYTSGANAPATQYVYDKLELGINNPLAIRDDGSGRNAEGKPNAADVQSLAWGLDRYDRHAHFNGNSIVDDTGAYTDGRTVRHLPILWARNATHGAVTSPRTLGIMDRSAGGAHAPASGKVQQITNFRIASWDLNWNGGEGAIAAKANPSNNAQTYGYKFPWESGIGSVDYPDILRRYQQFRTTMDGKDPARAQTQIPCVQADATDPEDYTKATPRPDQVEVSVDVPKYQPANTYNDGVSLQPRGYSRVMTAYVDSNRNGHFDSGTVRLGRPTTYQEAYRNFRYDVTVAPDPKIEVKETTVDVGVAPHGLGESMGWDFTAFTDDAAGRWTNDVKQWFKTLTVRNLGNVNLYRMRVDKDVLLLGDGAKYPILGENITSSLDLSMLGVNVELPAPITTGNLGYTLTKARVGDPDPTTLTIPDRRKWNVMSAADKADVQSQLRGEAPLMPMVSVRIPLSQPFGTYLAKDVRVYADLDNDNRRYVGERDWNGNGLLDSSGTMPDDENGNGILDAAEPSSDPGFDLTVSVKENQMTGGVFKTSLTQIDDDPASRVADTGSAAFRDPVTGKIIMFYTSNKRSDPPTGALYPNWDVTANDPRVIEFSRAPMYIHKAVLDTSVPDATAPWRVFWRPVAYGTGFRWWDAPYDPIPGYQWPNIDQAIYGTSAIVPYWQFNNTDTDRLQVKHYNPAVTVNEDNGKAYLVWSGSADITGAGTSGNDRSNEERVFVANVTGGNVDNTAAGISTVSSKPNVAKRNPSITAWGSGAGERIALLWQGMMGNRWGIFYNGSTDGVNWTDDAQVRTSTGLSTVGNPNAVYRYVHQLNTSGSGFDADLIDMIYTGTGKITRNSDILLSRYAPVANNNSMISPTKRALPLPRVFGEKLSYVSKYGFYNSEHTAWIRLDTRFENPILDNWGGSNIDLPFIHVVLGDGYEPTYPAGTVVSVTDGSVNGSGGTAIRPKVDSVTGVYTYEYPVGSPAADILGKSFVDYSEGVVKFSKPLINAGSGSGASKPEVYADYTPQSWRVTTDLAVDSSPRAFIERTQMTPAANPGMCSWLDGSGNPLPAPVDRLWVMWRKAATGAKSNVIYYKTYRMGVDLKTIAGANPVRINAGEDDPYGTVKYDDAYPFTGDPADVNGNGVRDRSGSVWAPMVVNGAVGPYEVDATGTKIYFTQVDERYPEMNRMVTKLRNAVPADPEVDSLGMSPGPITITYTDVSGAVQTIQTDRVFWIPEITEQSLTGQSSTANVNEGSIWAFADPNPPRFTLPDEHNAVPLSKIWLFWTSTRQDNTDIYWETVFPGLTVK